MLGILIRNQILENLYGIRFTITVVVCVVLMIATAVSGLGRYDAHVRDQKHIVSTNLGTLAEASDYHDAGREGVKIVKPANPLIMFSTGLEDSVGRTATVKEGDFPYMEDSIYSTAPIFAVFGQLDITFVIQTVLSLFAILFTFDLVSGEKERGTLKQCLSNSVPRNTFILGKTIGSFVSLLIPLLLSLIVGLLLILVIGGIEYSGEGWITLLMIFTGYIIYVAAFFSIGVFVSTLTRSPSVSFLILLFFWVVFVLIVPKGAMMIAGQVHPIPSINDVRADQFMLRENYNTTMWRRTAEEIERQGLMRSSGDHPPFQEIRAIRNTIREEMEPDFVAQNARLVEDFKRQQTALTELAVNLSRVSPSSALAYIGMNLAGTGYFEQENFLRQLTRYRELFNDYIERKDEAERQATSGRGFQGRMTAALERGELDLSDMPRFEYQPLSLSQRMAVVLPDFLALLIVTILFYALAFVNFLRYDVR